MLFTDKFLKALSDDNGSTILRSQIILLVIILTWIVIVLPSLFMPSISYLDDPTILYRSKNFSLKWLLPDDTSGRFYPLYWLYHKILYTFFGNELFGYYFMQCLIFLSIALILNAIVIRLTQSPFMGCLTAILFLTSSPIAENTYSLGKSEPKMLLFLIISLFYFVFFLDGKANDRNKSYKPYLLIFLFTLLALTIKESAFAMIGFGVAGFLLSFTVSKGAKINVKSWRSSPYKIYFLGSLSAFMLFQGLFILLRSSNAKATYFDYSITIQSIMSNFKFYLFQQPDLILLFLLTIAAIFYLLKKGVSLQIPGLVFAISLLAVVLLYFLILLLWRVGVGYYSLLPAALLSLAFTIIFGLVLQQPRGGRIVLLGLSLLLISRLYSIPYGYFIANAQRSSDIIYTEAINSFLKHAAPNSRLIVENWPFYSEPVYQSNLLIQKIEGKDSMSVAGVEDIIRNFEISEDIKRLYGIRTTLDKADRLPKKNDFLLVFTGERSSPWLLRSISPASKISDSYYKGQGMSVDLISWKEFRWMDFIHLRKHSLGYKLYRIEDTTSIFNWEGRDGPSWWIKERAVCRFKVQAPSETIILTIIATSHIVPVIIGISDGQKKLKDVIIHKEGEYSQELEFNENFDRNITLELRPNRTFVPKEMGINDDLTKYSVRVSLARGK